MRQEDEGSSRNDFNGRLKLHEYKKSRIFPLLSPTISIIMGCISIINMEMRDGVVAVLRGDIAMIQSLTVANGNAPIKLARWSGERRGVSDKGDIDIFQLSYAMYDALKNNEYGEKLHVQEMWNHHKILFPDMDRTAYDQFGFIIWNWMYEPGDNPYIDDEDYDFLLNDGVADIDIRLTNFGIQHMEDAVVKLLKEGATPYFLVHAPYITQIHEDKDGIIRHTYFDVAPMLDVTKFHSVDYWWQFIGDDLDKDISEFDTPVLERIVEGIFNVGACERILHLTDKFITDKARKEGDELMMKYLGEIRSITK